MALHGEKTSFLHQSLSFLPSQLLGFILHLRRWLFTKGPFSRYTAPVAVISVGNLRIGGTGKTPLVRTIVQLLLQEGHRPAILSRGYRRSGNGYVRVSHSSTVKEVGDEAVSQRNALSNEISVHVSRSRHRGIERILRQEPNTNVIILDDAFQHLSVSPDLNIVLTPFHLPFYEDNVFPAGMLREPVSAANHADLIMVTKCPPDLTIQQAEMVREAIHQKVDSKLPVLFTSINYLPMKPVKVGQQIEGPIALISGIADTIPLVAHLQSNYHMTHHFKFSDHHEFRQSELQEVLDFCMTQGCSLVTTEKDFVRLEWFDPLQQIELFIQPIEVSFLFDGQAHLMSPILDKIRNQPSG